MVREAERLLDSSWTELLVHRDDRLAELHGPEARETGWLSRQPLIERTELAEEMERAATRVSRSRYEWRRTSGSTGTPFHFVKDKSMCARMDAVMWAVYGWHGLAPGDRHGKLWGVPVHPLRKLRRRTLDFLLYRRRLSAFEISAESSRAFFLELASFEPRYLHGYATLLFEFASHCEQAGLDGADLGLRVVICTGEVLTPRIRRKLSSFFDCPLVNEYGCTESGTVAFECERGTLHLVPYASWPQVLGPRGKEVEPGSRGQVVITDLFGDLLPLVRYRLHDRATYLGQVACECGRELPAVEIDEGRLDAFIVTPQGKRIYDAILAYTVPEGVLRFRVEQKSYSLLEAAIVPAPGVDHSRIANVCKRRWEKQLGPGMTVDLRVVADLSLSHSGKLRYFVPLDE